MESAVNWRRGLDLWITIHSFSLQTEVVAKVKHIYHFTTVPAVAKAAFESQIKSDFITVNSVLSHTEGGMI